MNIKKEIKSLLVEKPLKLDCGKIINNFPLAYETYGELNKNKDNAILIFHALTGDQFVTGINPVTNKEHKPCCRKALIAGLSRAPRLQGHLTRLLALLTCQRNC